MAKSKKKSKATNQLVAANQKKLALTSVPMTPRNIYGTLGGAVQKSNMNQVLGFSFDFLRAVAMQSPLAGAIHSTREHQISHISKRYTGKRDEVGFRIVHEDEHDPQVDVEKLYPGTKEKCRRIERMFECPHEYYCPSFADFARQINNDAMTINRPAVETIFDIDENILLSFWPVDGALILPTLQFLQQFKSEQSDLFEGRYSSDPVDLLYQIYFENKKIDLSGQEYVIVRDSCVEGGYRYGRLIVVPEKTTTDINYAGYQPSLLEKAIVAILSFNNGFAYNSSYFTKGSMIDVILGISAAYGSENFIALKDTLQNNYSGLDGSWELPIALLEEEGILKAIKIKDSNKEMQFQEWINTCVSLATAIYRMNPESINFVGRGADGKALFERNKEREIATTVEEGLHARLNHVGTVCNRVVQRIDSSLRFEWVGLNRQDAKQEEEIYELQLKNYRTIDSIMIEKGEKPYKKWWSQCPLNDTILRCEYEDWKASQTSQEESDFGNEDYGQKEKLPDGIGNKLLDAAQGEEGELEKALVEHKFIIVSDKEDPVQSEW